MKSKTKMIVLSVTMFVAGIVTTLGVLWFLVLPDLAMDIGKFGYEGALRAYQCGSIDGTNGNTDMHDTYFGFDEEELNEINNWEYKYIR